MMDEKQSEQENSQAVLSQIMDEVRENPKKKGDTLPDQRLNEETKKETSQYGIQYDRRDESYTKLMKEYIDNYQRKAKANRIYKGIFFGVTVFAMISLIILPLIILAYMAFTHVFNFESIAVVLGSVASILTAVIILPKIIAEHLFPTNEDEHMIGMVKEMQKNDSLIRTSSTHQERGADDHKTTDD